MNHTLITRSYNGMAFTFREDGYFNMTKAAQHFGKRIDHFLANEETMDYLRALKELLPGIKVIKVQHGNGKSPSVGTFAHPKLAVFFARWLDVRFGVWCDAMIEDILTGKVKVAVVKPENLTGSGATFAAGVGLGIPSPHSPRHGSLEMAFLRTPESDQEPPNSETTQNAQSGPWVNDQ